MMVRAITEVMFDRLEANPTATTMILTRYEWELLTDHLGYRPPHSEGALVLGRPIVVLEDGEMSW